LAVKTKKNYKRGVFKVFLEEKGIHDLLSKYKEHLRVLNRSSSTIEAYTDHVRLFLNLTHITDIKRVTQKEIEDYMAALYAYKSIYNKPYCTNTICLKIRAVKRFFEFLENANTIFINPAESIKEPKKEKRLPRSILKPEEVCAILNQPNLGTKKGIRDCAILEVFYATGIRLGELCRLAIYDVDLTEQMLRINLGKGEKDRVVPMGKHTAGFLREYLRKARPYFIQKDKTVLHLFVNTYGKPISKQAVTIMVRAYARAADIKKQVSPHTFRHSFATALIRNGAEVTAVQKMLGHTNLRTTQRYIQSLGLDLKKAHQKAHPRERDKENLHTIKPKIERIRQRHESK
jgi:integrase/recombinase XerD